MRFFSFSSGLALLAAALLAGCCANNTCDCQDELEDAIQLRFKTSDTTSTRPTGFRLAELDTIRIVRYRLNSTVTDTVVRTRRKDEADKALVISPETPFNPNSSARPGLYRFAVLLTSGSRRRPQVRQRFELRDIQLRGRIEPDGCCTCYENTVKTASLLVFPLGPNAPASEPTPVNLNQIIELTRP